MCRNLRTFETLLSLLAERHAQELKLAALAKVAGVSQPTVKSWVGVLGASYLVTQVPPYFETLGKRVIKAPKAYLLDSALACALTRQPSASAALAGAMAGALFEGLIVAEAVKVFTMRGKRAELYFWRSPDGLEVDLLLPLGGNLVAVEIKLTTTPTAGHTEPLERFKGLAGKGAAGEAVLVCRVPVVRPLPGGNVALPWHEFRRMARRAARLTAGCAPPPVPTAPRLGASRVHRHCRASGRRAAKLRPVLPRTTTVPLGMHSQLRSPSRRSTTAAESSLTLGGASTILGSGSYEPRRLHLDHAGRP